tara:strand:+ start:883 stop:1449 length:567 start_codon:yes stop_codon:yes gene_type:complete
MSCGGFKPADARKTPTSGIERAQKNVREGRGVSLRDFGKPKSTTYEFSTSNPMWRATFDVIDFMPLTTVDYSGGLIITDWYTDDRAPNESLKFTIRFLSSDVRADSLKIIIHRKICKERSQCVVKKISSKLEDEIRTAIIRKAALLQKVAKEGKKEGKKKAKKGIFGSGDSLDEIRARDRKTKRDSGQ